MQCTLIEIVLEQQNTSVFVRSLCVRMCVFKKMYFRRRILRRTIKKQSYYLTFFSFFLSLEFFFIAAHILRYSMIFDLIFLPSSSSSSFAVINHNHLLVFEHLHICVCIYMRLPASLLLLL